MFDRESNHFAVRGQSVVLFCLHRACCLLKEQGIQEYVTSAQELHASDRPRFALEPTGQQEALQQACEATTAGK